MASKSAQHEPEKAEVIEELLETLDKTLDRVKVLYEQYFLGIQKQPPSHLHLEVERKIRELAQIQIRNTGLRYRYATLTQKFGSYNSYWRRTLRQIENGTYARNLHKVGRQAVKTGEEIPEEILAAMPKRMREQVRRDREAALALARRRDHDVPEEELLTLAPEESGPVFIQEPAELRRKALDPRRAHVIDESDDLDLDALLAEVADEPTAPIESPLAPLRGQTPPGQPARATGQAAWPVRPITQPGQGIPPRPASQPGQGVPPRPVSQPGQAVRSVTQPLQAAPPVAGHAPVQVPGQPVRPVTGQPGPAAPRPAAGPVVPPRPSTGPVVPPRPSTGPVVPRPATPPPGAPRPPPVPTGQPSTSLRPIPELPRPPSQQTHPIPIVPGAAAARSPVVVETMSGPFPRATPAEPLRSGPRQPRADTDVDSGLKSPVKSPPRSTARPPGMTDADVNALYAKYVKAKEAVGETAGPGAYNKLLNTINSQAPKIMEQYKAKGVDFSVVVKDNQVIIRAKPKP